LQTEAVQEHRQAIQPLRGQSSEHDSGVWITDSSKSLRVRKGSGRVFEKADCGSGECMKTPSIKRIVKKAGLRNPPVLIYGRILRIEAQKTQSHHCDAKCKAAGHRYYHNFKAGSKIYGMPDGRLEIK
jgi:hypothetical protein